MNPCRSARGVDALAKADSILAFVTSSEELDRGLFEVGGRAAVHLHLPADGRVSRTVRTAGWLQPLL